MNVPLLSIMIWSGFLIYWAGSSTDHTAQHQVYRIGFGSWTLFRLFPDSFYQFFHLDGQLTRGLAFHALFMWIFTANGLIYFLFLAFTGQWRNIVPDRQTFAQLAATLRRTASRIPISRRKAPRPGSKYNPAQRIAYTLINLMAVGSIITGVAIWKPTSLHVITSLCGGYQAARWLHFWLTIGFCPFFLLHVLQVARSGWNNFRSMIIGAQIVSLPAKPIPHLQAESPVVFPGGTTRE
jgi:thiosulfate reductase cytochrome b subunit